MSMNRIVSNAAGVAIILAVFLQTAAAAQDRAAGREEAAQRERRIIFDNDGNEPVYYCEEATPEALLNVRTTPLPDTQVDTIFYCTWSSGFGYFTHHTKVGDVFTCTEEGFDKNKTAAFLEKGLDPLEVMVEFCREHGIEVFWSMRMNDIHDGWSAWYSKYLFPPIKRAHPEWLVGTADNKPQNGSWTAIDYTVPEVRDYAYRFFEEVCQNYDVDGVQLDFFRHPVYFKKHAQGQPCGQEELDMVTNLLARIRKMADAEGAERGKPILISVRVPDSAPLCRAMGFDIERWMADGLIDLMVVSGYFRVNPWETSVALGQKHGVPVYPCISESRIRDKEAKKLRASVECYRGRAMNAWHSGMSGIYMFNFFNPDSPLWNELGDPKALAKMDKVYVTAARGPGNLTFWYDGGMKFMNRSIVTPAQPRAIAAGAAETINLLVGEDVAETRPESLSLECRFKGAPGDVAVALNGNTLTPEKAEGEWLYFTPAIDAFNHGDNEVAVSRAADAEGEMVMLDLALRVDHAEVE